MTEFTNHFLIAMPHLTDPNFARSLVYIFEHDDQGSMGVIVNKPFPLDSSEDILDQTRMNLISPVPPIYFGGPVGVNQGLFLHGTEYAISDTVQLTEGICVTSNPTIISDLIQGNGPRTFRCTFGYAGWGASQLNREFENGDWLVMPSDSALLFSSPDDHKWENAARQFGIDIMDITGHTGFA